MIEVFSTIGVTHLYLVLLYDKADLIHNDRKHTNADHHADNCEDHFQVTNCIVVTITNC